MNIQHYDSDERDLRARYGLTMLGALLVMGAGYFWATTVSPLFRVTR